MSSIGSVRGRRRRAGDQRVRGGSLSRYPQQKSTAISGTEVGDSSCYGRGSGRSGLGKRLEDEDHLLVRGEAWGLDLGGHGTQSSHLTLLCSL